jgi:hypothetical protein
MANLRCANAKSCHWIDAGEFARKLADQLVVEG